MLVDSQKEKATSRTRAFSKAEGINEKKEKRDLNIWKLWVCSFHVNGFAFCLILTCYQEAWRKSSRDETSFLWKLDDHTTVMFFQMFC